MSYDIYIGEALLRVPSADSAEEWADTALNAHVLPHVEEGAPSFPGDSMTGRENHRHPAYGAWDEFLRQVGLYALFKDDDEGLMRHHPGCFLLRPRDLVAVRSALESWKARAWPTEERIPGWDPKFKLGDSGEPDPRYDAILARLIWLEWWFAWALNNCRVPAIYNR